MSYCRWSNDDFQCDVYVYESQSGYQTHVAGRKRRWMVPLPPQVEDIADNIDAYLERHQKVMAMLDRKNEGVLWVWEDLPESHAGESYTDSTPDECADTLEMLRAAGYNVPQYAIDDLRAEGAGTEGGTDNE